MIKAELHVHTRYSHDSILALRLLYLMCRLHNVKCIAITDHNQIEGAVRFKKAYPQIMVIIGEEISTLQGEVIGLFLKSRIPEGLSARETIERIHKQHGIVYIPHPCDTKRRKSVILRDSLYENRELIHFVESYNGRTRLQTDILQQKKISHQFNSPEVVGSDAHTFFEIGRNYILFPSQITDKDSFIKNISLAKMHTARCHFLAHLATKFARAVKLISRGQYKELLNKILKTKGEHL